MLSEGRKCFSLTKKQFTSSCVAHQCRGYNQLLLLKGDLAWPAETKGLIWVHVMQLHLCPVLGFVQSLPSLLPSHPGSDLSQAAVSALCVLTARCCPCRQDPHPHGVQGRAGFLRHETEVSPAPWLGCRGWEGTQHQEMALHRSWCCGTEAGLKESAGQMEPEILRSCGWELPLLSATPLPGGLRRGGRWQSSGCREPALRP